MNDNNNWAKMKAAERWGRLGATVENIQDDVKEIKAFNAALGAKVDANEKRIAQISTRCDERYTKKKEEKQLGAKARAAIASAIILSVGGIIVALIELFII